MARRTEIGARGVAVLALLALSCASGGEAGRFRFFSAPHPDYAPWYHKVRDWQVRELRDGARVPLPDTAAVRSAGPYSGLLRVAMARWRDGERLSMARRVAEWAQRESRRHYRFDPITDAAGDPWPTSHELLTTDKDDCDGLDLIAYQLLLEFGFPTDELFRAVLRRDRDRSNHMVTLWFEDPEDPWVIDSVGAVTERVRRFSELPGWTPTAVFNAEQHFAPAAR